MSDELRAAAERRRQHKAAGSISSDSPYYDASASHRWPYSRLLDADAALLADAWLAEHDPEPVTAEWLKSVGFVFGYAWGHGRPYIELGAGANTVIVSQPKSGDDWSCEEWLVGRERVPHGLMPSTRGAVRRLLAALGIEVSQ